MSKSGAVVGEPASPPMCSRARPLKQESTITILRRARERATIARTSSYGTEWNGRVGRDARVLSRSRLPSRPKCPCPA